MSTSVSCEHCVVFTTTDGRRHHESTCSELRFANGRPRWIPGTGLETLPAYRMTRGDELGAIYAGIKTVLVDEDE